MTKAAGLLNRHPANSSLFILPMICQSIGMHISCSAFETTPACESLMQHFCKSLFPAKTISTSHQEQVKALQEILLSKELQNFCVVTGERHTRANHGQLYPTIDRKIYAFRFESQTGPLDTLI